MEINAKELIKLTEEIDEQCFDFALWFNECVCFFDTESDKYNLNDFEFYTKKELLDMYKKKFIDKTKK